MTPLSIHMHTYTNRAFLVSMQQESLVRVYKLNKKENGALGKITPSLDFPIVCVILNTSIIALINAATERCVL